MDQIPASATAAGEDMQLEGGGPARARDAVNPASKKKNKAAAPPRPSAISGKKKPVGLTDEQKKAQFQKKKYKQAERKKKAKADPAVVAKFNEVMTTAEYKVELLYGDDMKRNTFISHTDATFRRDFTSKSGYIWKGTAESDERILIWLHKKQDLLDMNEKNLSKIWQALLAGTVYPEKLQPTAMQALQSGLGGLEIGVTVAEQAKEMDNLFDNFNFGAGPEED